MTTTFDYETAEIQDLQVETKFDEKSGKSKVQAVLLEGEPLAPSDRFWNSLYARFGFNSAFFKYFDHQEVFGRIAEKEASTRLRLCVERTDGDKPRNRLLAVSNPTKPVVHHDELMEMLEGSNHEGISYSDGIIESKHRPRIGGTTFDIAGDAFQNRFQMYTPIDGYGKPNVYLALLRQICTNGMVGFAKAFRSEVSLGKGDDNVAFALTRVLDQFNNDEGYAAIRQRMEAATTSWASVHEATNLYKLLIKLHNQTEDGGQLSIRRIGNDGASSDTPVIRKALRQGSGDSPLGEETLNSGIITAYHGLTGDTTKLYGLANLDALSIKRQRTLPVKCSVYDMVNFATEVATHHALPNAARRLNAWVGSMISGEYDMEGTMSQYGDFADFHMGGKLAAGLTGSN